MIMADDPRETPAQHIEMQAETGVIEQQGAATQDPQVAPTPAAPAPPQSELDKMEDKVEEVVKEVEALTDADIKAALRWMLSVLPAPLRDSFYKHHPKFQP